MLQKVFANSLMGFKIVCQVEVFVYFFKITLCTCVFKNHAKIIGFHVFDGIEFDVQLGVGVKICRVKFKHKKSKILGRNLRKKMLIKKMDFRPKNFKKT